MHDYAVRHIYDIGLTDWSQGKCLPPAGPNDDPYVRAYWDGYNCADRLRHVLPEDIIGSREVPDTLVNDVLHMDLIDRATGEGRR